MTRATLLGPLLPTGLIAVFMSGALAQDTPAGRDELLEKWMAVYQQRAESFEMLVNGDPQLRLELHPTPLLKYTNPVRNVQQHGSLYLWTQAGRPALVAAVWSALDRTRPELRRLNLEWHSLLTENVVAKRNSEVFWQSEESGVEWQNVSNVELPAGSRALRLAQMRRIARSLTARIATGESELRLMAQPLYRYPAGTPDVIDGALFAYVMGTDPEVVLLVEARRTDNGSPAWQIGSARFTNYPIEVRRGEQVLWAREHAMPEQHTGAYALFLAVEKLPADLIGSAAAAASPGANR